METQEERLGKTGRQIEKDRQTDRLRESGRHAERRTHRHGKTAR